MDELFITDARIAQARKLHSSSVQALQNIQFMGQPLLNSEVPDFSATTHRAPVVPRIQAFGPNEQRQNLILPPEINHEQLYSKPLVPSGIIPTISYSRTLYRKSDYAAYNKQLPEMPKIWPADKVVSQSGLFITPPQSPAESAPTSTPELESVSVQRNFSRRFIKEEVKRCDHLPVIQRTETYQSESAEIYPASPTPVSALSEADRTSFNLLADSLKRSLSPASPLHEKKTNSR